MYVNFLTGAGVRSFVLQRMLNNTPVKISLRNVVKLQPYQLFLSRFDITKFLQIKCNPSTILLYPITYRLLFVHVAKRRLEQL